MARPATGSPRWSDERQRWEARVTLSGGVRKIVPMPGIAKEDTDKARRVAQRISDLARKEGRVPESTAETLNEWIPRWLDARTAKKLSTVEHDRGRLKNHVQPIIGTRPVAEITREDIERVVEDLDRKVRLPHGHKEHLAWKTAANVWTLVTKLFKDAVNAKERALRMRENNPARDVRGPDRGDKRSKAYLYPSEFLRLVGCKDVPIAHRFLYAAAVYTFARAGELQALLWSDVDLEHGIIHITKSIDRRTGKVVATKSGETRRIPIEPHLLPLLQHLHATRTTDTVLWMPEAEHRAVNLREHLLTAGVARLELHHDDEYSMHLVFHSLRSTGITWSAVAGVDPLKIMQRAGHRGFVTTQGYIREADNLRAGFGRPFPELPPELAPRVSAVLASHPPVSSTNQWSKGGSNP